VPLIRFLASSLALSIPVLLRMLPIFAATGVIVFGAVSGLINHPGYLLFVAAITTFPLMAFLQICAIRAGLVHRRQSRGPELGILVRKSLYLGLVQAALFIFYAILLLGVMALAFDPQTMGEWKDSADVMQQASASPAGLLATLWGLDPLLFAGFVLSLLIYSAAQVALGVPFAAHGAAAAVNGPRHEFLYGIGRKFVPLALVGLLGAVLGWAAGPFLDRAFLGAAGAGATAVPEGGIFQAAYAPVAAWIASKALLGAWTFSWFAAACAVAYVDVRDTIEAEFQETLGAIRASAEPPADIAGMMRERNERLRRVAPAAAAAPAAFDAFETEEAEAEIPREMPEPLALGDPVPAEEDEEPRMPYPEDEVAERGDIAPEDERKVTGDLTQDEVEARFSSRFGGEQGSGLRDDIAAALREAAHERTGSDEDGVPGDMPASEVLPGVAGAALEAEQIPPVVPDLHESAPEGEDVPEWMRKYLGSDGDRTLFGDDGARPGKKP
jgi:hypothetical protein